MAESKQARRVHKWRKAHGISVRELCAAVGSDHQLQKWLYGTVDTLPLHLRVALAEHTGLQLESLLDSRLHIEHPVMRGARSHFPGILIGEPGRHVVWGLTYRFLESFLKVIGQPLPERRKSDRV